MIIQMTSIANETNKTSAAPVMFPQTLAFASLVMSEMLAERIATRELATLRSVWAARAAARLASK